MSLISIPSLSRLPVLAASLVALLITGSTFAQGERLAAECVQQMRETASSTGEAIRSAAHRGISAIQSIDSKGGTDEELITAAHLTKSAIDRQAHAGADRVNATAQRCTSALADLGASRRLIRRVNHTRRLLLGSISSANQAASSQVRTALHRALNN